MFRQPGRAARPERPGRTSGQLRDQALSLPGVRAGASTVSVPGAVAFFLDTPPRPAAVPDLFGDE
jgi:hypothetical protein